jgi:hypothetical protein
MNMETMAVRSRLAIIISRRNTERLESGQKRLTLRAVAADSGVPLSVIYGLTTDRPDKQSKQVAFETISKLCRALQVTPGDILEYIPDETA